MPRYLTKSRFKLGLSCETKLFYTKKKGVYADQSLDDSFLQALAEGGFQVGELAKFYFCDDPVAQDITIESLDYEESLAETQKRLRAGKPVLAEAAFRYENLFIRADIVEFLPDAKKINLIEVKAKSYDSTDSFFSYNRKTEEAVGIKTEWKEYLYDVAFQKYVLSKLYPDYTIKAFLMLANKEAAASIDGLNQFFKINKAGQRTRVDIEKGLTRDKLGDAVLIQVPVDDEVRWIWGNPVATDVAPGISFSDYVSLLSEKYQNDEKIPTPLGSKCSACEFKTTVQEDAADILKSGFKECWLEQSGLDGASLKKPLVIELWSGLVGRRSLKQELIDNKVYLLEKVTEELIAPAKDREYSGMSPLTRRMLQIEKAKNNDDTVYLDRKGLKNEMKTWVFPLHCIDFETSRVALPFHAGRRPYEQIAFQFSHHSVQSDGSIKHEGQYISFEPGYFPNYDFLRALKKNLDKDSGTIFRYHNHENSVLVDIYKQLRKDAGVPDRDELMAFIREITKGTYDKEKWEGSRNMVDLYQLVLSYYYPPAAGGSNSLKYILPATIKASKFLQEKYSTPVYGGAGAMPSLNFKDKVWLTPETPYNPYKALPAIFEDFDAETLDQLVEGFDEIADGGAAMTAYAKLQFSDVAADQREMLRDGLLKYCELDTLAMVMIWEYWNEQVKGA